MPDHPRTASAAQAELLLSSAYEDVIEALCRAGEGGAGAAELARISGRPLSTVHAQLTRLTAAGVVQVSAVQARAGRPVRIYTLPLPWRVPFEVTPAETLRELLGGGFQTHVTRQLDALATRMQKLGEGWAIIVKAEPNGIGHRIEAADMPVRGEPLAGYGFHVHLTRDRAAQLIRRMNELIEEYRDAPDGPEAPAWTGTVLFTPGG